MIRWLATLWRRAPALLPQQLRRTPVPRHFVPADKFSVTFVRVSEAGTLEVTGPPGYNDQELETMGLAQSYLICGELKHQTPYVLLAPGLHFEVLDPRGNAARAMSPLKDTHAGPDGFLLGNSGRGCSLWQPLLPSAVVRGRRRLLELHPAS